MADHRGPRPRYGRLTLVTVSAAVTAVAVLGGAGALPTGDSHPPAVASTARDAMTPTPSPSAPVDTVVVPTPSGLRSKTPDPSQDQQVSQEVREASLPTDSGSGRRVVFSESRQRVWLVDSSGRIRSTYPVSGSRYDNLSPGTYEVYSRSEQASGVDGSTMNYFVRFAHGASAAIGFHDIPELGGEPVQTTEQLGTPLSHGCVRQRHVDAELMWEFAPIGTTVVVTA